jgi:membrane protein involved in colicin uptake
MVGWVLPLRVLLAAVIACKVAFVVAAFAIATAAFGAAGSWLSVGSFVQVVLLKLGAGVGVVWVGSIMLDDLARIIDPVKWARRQQQKLERRGKSPRLWQQQQQKRRGSEKLRQRRQQQQQQQQQQQRQVPDGGFGPDAGWSSTSQR